MSFTVHHLTKLFNDDILSLTTSYVFDRLISRRYGVNSQSNIGMFSFVMFLCLYCILSDSLMRSLLIECCHKMVDIICVLSCPVEVL